MKRLTASTGLVGPNGGVRRPRGGIPGNRGGYGTTDAFRLRMQMVLQRSKAAEVLEKIISGDILEMIGVSKAGDVLYGPTKNRDRIAAIELASRIGHSLPSSQPILHFGPLQVRVVAE